MSKYKILVKITGSIAAYKSAYLVSRLVQDGNEVITVATESALKFIGPATLEGLTGNPVYTDSFETGKMMSHINLVKWADLSIVCPASANTINKMASGISDSLPTSLFLAHDRNKPYLVAPAMNTAMFNHPSTQESIKKLSGWGVSILPTAEGYLACGDYGSGKLLEPDSIINHIYSTLYMKTTGKSILITAGGTKENIDGIRSITNLSSGRTAASIADHFIKQGYKVTYLCAKNAKRPAGAYEVIEFTDFKSLDSILTKVLSNCNFDLVIHNAAVSDYSLHSVTAGESELRAPINRKIQSAEEFLTIKLIRNHKIVNRIKSYSHNRDLKLVSFKFTNDPDESIRAKQVRDLIKESKSDYVVQNDLSDRTEKDEQMNFNIFGNEGKLESVKTVIDLAGSLENIIFNERR